MAATRDPNLLDETPEESSVYVTVVSDDPGDEYIRVRCERPGERPVSVTVRLAAFDDAVTQALATSDTQRVPAQHPPPMRGAAA